MFPCSHVPSDVLEGLHLSRYPTMLYFISHIKTFRKHVPYMLYQWVAFRKCPCSHQQPPRGPIHSNFCVPGLGLRSRCSRITILYLVLLETNVCSIVTSWVGLEEQVLCIRKSLVACCENEVRPIRLHDNSTFTPIGR